MSQIYSVTGLSRALENVLKTQFSTVHVKGEVAQLTIAASGHWYLVLRDATSTLTVVVWRSDATNLKFRPKSGQKVVCRGRLGVYGHQSRYQLYATDIQPAGEGALAQKIAQIRAKLLAEGFLDPRRKRALPTMPKVVGVATSLKGAALQDFLRVSRHRFPSCRVLVAPCQVQGPMAAPSIVRALELLYDYGKCEVVVITRGGGSKEDLLPFQDETVARWIGTAPIPIVVAVGHEIDRCICDDVADASAPTPSAAAMLVFPDKEQLVQRVDEGVVRLVSSIQRMVRRRRELVHRLHERNRHPFKKLEQQRKRVQQLVDRLLLFMRHIERDRRQVQQLHERLLVAQQNHLSNRKYRVESLAGRLQALSPKGVLDRGYAIVHHKKMVVSSVDSLKISSVVQIQLSDGRVKATVDEIQPKTTPTPS